MKLHFLYVEGISRIDTPYFATIGEQFDYFDSHEVVEIDSTFYPPHYTNRIKVDADEIDFNTQVNYLYFEFNDKYYYYFIDDVEYISETVAYLYITLDTIQTYMFNVFIQNGIIERKFINRWYGSFINRNYLRENVSEGYYEVDWLNIKNDDKDWFYIFVATEFADNKNIPSIITFDENFEDNAYPSKGLSTPMCIKFLPYDSECRFYSDEPNFDGQLCETTASLGRYVQKDYCVDAFLVPFNPFNHITYDETTHKLTSDSFYEQISYSNKPYFIRDWYVNPNDPGPSTNHDYSVLTSNCKIKRVAVWQYDYQNPDQYHEEYVVPLKSYSGNDSILFSSNTNILVPFNSKFMPVLLDDNYIRYSFGSNYANASFPLYILTQPVIDWKYYCNVENGNIIYCVDNTSNFYDEYRTTVVDTNLVGVTMKNSPWESYVSSNRSRWIGAIGETALDVASKGANMAIRSARYSAKEGMIVSDTRNYTPKTHVLKKKYTRQLTDIQADKTAMMREGAVDIAKGTIGGVIGQAIQDANVFFSPAKSVQKGNNTSMITHDWEIFSKLEKVRDYEICAQYYHRNGYLVDEYVNAISNIFTYVNTRYYFNVLKMRDVDLHLHNVLEDTNTIGAINDRLEQGVRLWNVELLSHRDTELDINITFNSSIPSLNPGDTVILEFEDGNNTTVTGKVAFFMETETSGVYLLSVYTNQIKNIGSPLNYSHLTYNGVAYSFDYSNFIWHAEVNYYPAIGDFQYDNVEKDFVS